jgi:NADH-quinone oxidoreductase subunit I
MAQKHRNPFVQYFADIWAGIYSTYQGMRLTITYFFKPKVTMEYPEVRPEVPESHRGLHKYIEEKCNLCGQCAEACPVDCIAVHGLGKGKDVLIEQYEIDYSKCLFCHLCCEACKSDCLFMGPEFDLASASRAGCVRAFASSKEPEQVEKFKEFLAQKDAERKAKAAAAAAAKAAKAAEAPAAKPAAGGSGDKEGGA